LTKTQITFAQKKRKNTNLTTTTATAATKPPKACGTLAYVTQKSQPKLAV
jgi:hypothetical protein